MLTIIKYFEFEAAHKLPKHPGKCKFVHGHSYKLEIGISGLINPDTGMIADFSQLKLMVKEMIIDRLDHSYFNELNLGEFPSSCPTAENMVEWIVSQLQPRAALLGCEVVLVQLWETSGSRVEWRK